MVPASQDGRPPAIGAVSVLSSRLTTAPGTTRAVIGTSHQSTGYPHMGVATMELVFAYIDPGSGSLLIQGLIAALVAIPVFFRHQIGRAISAVRGKPKAEPAAVPAPDEPGATPQA